MISNVYLLGLICRKAYAIRSAEVSATAGNRSTLYASAAVRCTHSARLLLTGAAVCVCEGRVAHSWSSLVWQCAEYLGVVAEGAAIIFPLA